MHRGDDAPVKREKDPGAAFHFLILGICPFTVSTSPISKFNVPFFCHIMVLSLLLMIIGNIF